MQQCRASGSVTAQPSPQLLDGWDRLENYSARAHAENLPAPATRRLGSPCNGFIVNGLNCSHHKQRCERSIVYLGESAPPEGPSLECTEILIAQQELKSRERHRRWTPPHQPSR